MLEINNMLALSTHMGASINAIVLDHPAYLDVRNAPQALKDAAINMINAPDGMSHNHKKFINNVVNAINQPSNKDTTQQFIEVSRLKDQYKNQDIESLEIWKYYE
jgi:hypothetical protein